MTIFWWGIAILGLVAVVVLFSLCDLGSRCSRDEETLEREIAKAKEA